SGAAPVPPAGGGARRLTTGRYYPPSGRSIQAKGIEPEVKVEEELPKDLNKDVAAAVGEASLRGHLKNPDDEAVADELDGRSSFVPEDKTKDTQLNYALDVLHGIKSVDTSADKKVQTNYLHSSW